MFKSRNMEMDQKSILIVEDEGIVSIDIRNILNRLGYYVCAVAFTASYIVKPINEKELQETIEKVFIS